MTTYIYRVRFIDESYNVATLDGKHHNSHDDAFNYGWSRVETHQSFEVITSVKCDECGCLTNPERTYVLINTTCCDSCYYEG